MKGTLPRAFSVLTIVECGFFLFVMVFQSVCLFVLQLLSRCSEMKKQTYGNIKYTLPQQNKEKTLKMKVSYRYSFCLGAVSHSLRQSNVMSPSLSKGYFLLKKQCVNLGSLHRINTIL